MVYFINMTVIKINWFIKTHRFLRFFVTFLSSIGFIVSSEVFDNFDFQFQVPVWFVS